MKTPELAPPGRGKSAILKKWAKKKGLKVVDFKLPRKKALKKMGMPVT